MSYLAGPRPRLFAHRGASGTVPENTLQAFREGLAAGADRLELDVHATADGAIVVFHDEELDRTTDGSGPLRLRTLDEIRRLDAGYRFRDAAGSMPFRGRGLGVPTLDEVLEEFPGVALNIEVKSGEPGTVERYFEVLDRHGARDRVLSAAFEHDILAQIRAAAPGAVTSLSALETTAFVMACLGGGLDGFQAAPGVALQVPPEHEGIPVVTPVLVEAAHARGLEVHVWTINEEHEMDRLLDLGVDGLMTDFPALARAVFERRGLREPAAR